MPLDTQILHIRKGLGMKVELDSIDQSIVLIDILSLADSDDGTIVVEMDATYIVVMHKRSNSKYRFEVNEFGVTINYLMVHGLPLNGEAALFVPWKNCVRQVDNQGGAVTGITTLWAIGATTYNLQEVVGDWIINGAVETGELDLREEHLNFSTGYNEEDLSERPIISYYSHLKDKDFEGFDLTNPDTWPMTVWDDGCELALHSMFCSGIGNVVMQLPNDLVNYIPTDFRDFRSRFAEYLPTMASLLRNAFPEKKTEILTFLTQIALNIDPNFSERSLVVNSDATVHELTQKD